MSTAPVIQMSFVNFWMRVTEMSVTSFDELNPETIMIGYQMKKEWITEHNSSTVVISLFTTS
jgi:hypothetical protein